jgi:hypothetical protein
VIHKIFSDIGTTNKRYVEFGTQSGKECNTRRLRETCGWSGLLMDGGHSNASIGLHRHFITRENIGSLLRRYDVPMEPDLLSVDVDGNDFHVLTAILHRGYRPRVVIVETDFWLNETIDATIAYSPNHAWLGMGSCWGSASVLAYRNLARRFGYAIILGMAPDLYWVHDDVLQATVGPNAYDTTNDVSRICANEPAPESFFDGKLPEVQDDCWAEHVRRGYVTSATAIRAAARANA